MEDLRRTDDRRINDLDRKITNVAKDVSAIRDMLISEPQASPMGRALLQRADANAAAINKLRQDYDEDHEWITRMRGTWQAIAGAGVIFGIIGTVFGIAAYFGR